MQLNGGLRPRYWKMSLSFSHRPKLDELSMPLEDSHCFDCICSYIEGQKKKLDRIPQSDYNVVRTSSDPFEKVCSRLRRNLNVYNCNRGWLKMTELIVTYDLMKFKRDHRSKPELANTVCALFNCELPGGFISAADHYTKSRNLTFDWYASSLHPKSDTLALEDTYDLMKKYPYRWLMNERADENGDMTNPAAVAHLLTELKSRLMGSLVDLYVADGGMDIASDYSNQEVLHQGLVAGEMLACLQTIKRGGNAVIKMYTFCTAFMRSIIAIATFSFDKVYLSKPHTSRPMNTEIYLVMIHYNIVAIDVYKLIENALSDITEASRNRQAAPPLINMGDPAMASFNSECVLALDAISKSLRVSIDEHVSRSNKMDKRSVWKNAKLGAVDLTEWMSAMDIPDLGDHSI